MKNVFTVAKASVMARLSLGIISLIGSISAGIGPAMAREGALAAATLDKARDRGPVRVIVQLDLPSRPEAALSDSSDDSKAAAGHAQAIAAAQAAVLQDLSKANVTSLRQFETLPFMAMKADARALKALERSPQVVAIREDRARPAALAESIPIVEADQAWSAGFDGSGQVVAVLDSGVDRNHSFLSGKVVDEASARTMSSSSGAKACRTS